MAKITIEMIEKSYKLGKKRYFNEIPESMALDELVKLGMERTSASNYLECVKKLIQGVKYTRTTNLYSINYFLNCIYKDFGINGLINATHSFDLHIKYRSALENSSKSSFKKILANYLKIINDSKLK